KNGLVPVKPIPLSSYFKNYHIPLSFHLDEKQIKEGDFDFSEISCISSKIHNFGAMTFCYKIPFSSSLDKLKEKLINIKSILDKNNEQDAKKAFHKIISAIKKPRFYNLKNFYFTIQVEPLEEIVSSKDYKEAYGSKIASLLRLETESLSEYQLQEILGTTTGYSGEDFMIIDTEASFIYDDEYFEVLEFFEFANLQLLELRYFDRLLDNKLNFFYVQKHYKMPLKAYIPLIGQRTEQPISLLAQLKVDISVIIERLDFSIKMAGDTYYSNVYSILRDQLSLDEWRLSINKKLGIIHDIYTIYQDRLDIIHDEILTVVIILLIALEAAIAFWH
ncbi:hypothetical protein ACFLYH_01540, partial [Candidatus Dependentiae bacterium]